MIKKFRPKKFWFILTDGIDCSGKTTFIKEFNKETNFSTWIVDRSTISVEAYASKFNRNIPSSYDLEKHIEKWPYTLLIRFVASKEDTIKRQSKKNDGYDPHDYEIDMDYFDKELVFSGFDRVITLNSSEKSIKEEIKIVVDYMKQFEKLKEKEEKYCEAFKDKLSRI